MRMEFLSGLWILLYTVMFDGLVIAPVPDLQVVD